MRAVCVWLCPCFRQSLAIVNNRLLNSLARSLARYPTHLQSILADAISNNGNASHHRRRRRNNMKAAMKDKWNPTLALNLADLYKAMRKRTQFLPKMWALWRLLRFFFLVVIVVFGVRHIIWAEPFNVYWRKLCSTPFSHSSVFTSHR